MMTTSVPTELAKILERNRLSIEGKTESRRAHARRLGFSEGFLRHIEAGKLPSDPHKIEALARSLGRDPEHFARLIERERQRQEGAS